MPPKNTPIHNAHVVLANVRLPSCWLDKPRWNQFKSEYQYTGTAAFRKDDEKETAEYRKIREAVVSVARQCWSDLDEKLMWTNKNGETLKLGHPFRDGDRQEPPANANAEWKPWDAILGCNTFRFKAKSRNDEFDPQIYWWAVDEEGQPITLDRKRNASTLRKHLFGNCVVSRFRFRIAGWEIEPRRFVAIYPEWVQVAKDPGIRKSRGELDPNDLNQEKGAPPPVDSSPPPSQSAPPESPPESMSEEYEDLDDDVPF